MVSTPAAVGRIFVCYRRDDTAYSAGWLYDRLASHFGADQVIKDICSIEPGDDLVEVISAAVGSCDVLLALIGAKWLTVTDEQGHRRLDYPGDFVRLEIEAALVRNVRIIPVLVEEAQMPRVKDLPPTLGRLARFQALRLDPNRFASDTGRLVSVLENTLAEVQREGTTRRESRIQATQLERPKIFLCYRREDTQGFARGIYQSLAGKYGHEQVFRDIDSTPAGVRFSTWIESRVGQCSVMIVLIGNLWSAATDPNGQRRLALPKDWVRQEIEAALRRAIPIIPVCIQGAPMPSEDELPPSIADLTGFQFAEVTDSRWDYDVGMLIEAIDNLVAADGQNDVS